MHIVFGWGLDGHSYLPTRTGCVTAIGQTVVGPTGLLNLLEEQSGRNPIGAGYFMVRQQTLLFAESVPFSEAHHVPRLGRGRIDS